MAVTTASELCQLIEKSNILGAGPLEKAKTLAASEADAKSLARVLIEQKLLTSWQARQLMAGVSGLRLGKYVLLDELGRGDLGRVYLAEHTQLVRRAALKLLSRELCDNKELLRRFLGEARLIASLDHPNVVHTLDVSSESDRYYVVFEYVAGRDLTKRVADQGRLSAKQAAELVLQVAEGLVHAHEKGVVHADLKPGNLMVDAHGNIKILDIGVDRLGISLQAANAAAGRPATTPSLYRAPELAKGVDSLTPKCDLFSLGMVFVFLVTGEDPPPPDADLGQTQSDAILSQLSVACPDLPEELARLCGQLTSEDPAQRLDSMAALRDTLRDWLATCGDATTATDSPTTSPADEDTADAFVSKSARSASTAAAPAATSAAVAATATATGSKAAQPAKTGAVAKPLPEFTAAMNSTAGAAGKPVGSRPAGTAATTPAATAGLGKAVGSAPTATASTAKTPATKTPATKTPAAKTPAANASPARTAAEKVPAEGVPATKSPAARPPAGKAGQTGPAPRSASGQGAVGAAAKAVKQVPAAPASIANSDSGSENLDPLGLGDSASSFLAAADTEGAAASGTDAAAETSLSFTVKTGGKRTAGKSVKPGAKPAAKSKSTTNAVAEEGNANDAGDASVTPARKIPLWVWIAGGAGAAGVTLIVVIITLVVMIFGGSGKPTQVAESGGSAANGTQNAGDTATGTPLAGDESAGAANPAGDASPANSEGVAPAGPVPGTAEPGTAPAAADATQPGNPAAPPAGANTAPADPLAILLGGGNPPALAPGATPNPAAGNPASAPPTTPGTPTSPESPAGKPESPMASPSPTTAAAPKPTTPPPPPAPKPAPKPMGDPLKDFPKEFIELPALAKDGPIPEPVSLGKVAMPPKSLLIIHLLGGDGAIKGKSRFVMEAADGGTAERDWDIFLREGEAESGGVKVAHLSLKENDLMFQWEAEAPQQLASPHLINCMLQLAAGPKQATVALRKPIEVEPLKAEILKGTLKGKFDVPFPPNSDRMKVDIVFDGPFPPLKFEGQNPMDSDKGKATVWFGASQETQIFALRLDTVFRRQLEIGFDPHVRINTTAKPEKLTAAGLGKMQKAAEVARQQTFAMVEFGKKAAGGKNDETTQQRLSLMESQLTNITKASEQLAGLKGMADQLVQGGRIHVRVFCQVDDFKLELVRTAGIPAANQK